MGTSGLLPTHSAENCWDNFDFLGIKKTMAPNSFMDPPEKSALGSENFDPGVALERWWHRM
jgi:hypothetical protein